MHIKDYLTHLKNKKQKTTDAESEIIKDCKDERQQNL